MKLIWQIFQIRKLIQNAEHVAITIFFALSLVISTTGSAQQSSVQFHNLLGYNPKLVGEALFRVLLFDIYEVQLFSPNGAFNGAPPYALKLRYFIDIERQSIVETSLDEMRRQGISNEGKLKEWEDWMTKHFPNMKSGDEAIMAAVDEGGMVLFHNGIRLGQSYDPSFTDAFFGIWLSDNARKPNLSRALRGLGSE